MSEAGGHRIASPILVGRDEELGLLDRVLDDAVGGRPRVVIVGGEAGIGKSRLVAEFAARARSRGVRVLEGSSLPSGLEMPYLPFIEMLRTLARDLEPGERDAILAAARPQLARLLPELARPTDRAEVPSGSWAPGLEQLRLHEALFEVVERLGAHAPTAFVFEDVQWADEASLTLVARVARRLRQGRALLVLTTRTDEPGSRVVAFVSELERSVPVERVELAPLSLLATERQVRAIAGHAVDRDRVEEIHRLAGGNPFYTEELLAFTATGALSPGLRDVLQARLNRLPAGTREVVRLASVAGRVIDDGLLAQATGANAAQVSRELRAAVSEHILVADGPAGQGGLRFRHDLLREAVSVELLAAERARLHGAIAASLASGRSRDAAPGEIAYHWDQAGERARALAAHIDAGFAAERAYAFADARRHFDRALELWDEVPYADDRVALDRVHLAHRAAETAALAGDHHRAIAVARSILAVLDERAQPDFADLVRTRLRWYLWEAGEREQALAEAAGSLRRRRPRASRAHLTALAHHAGLLLLAGRTGEAHREARTALRLARATGCDEEEALALGVLGWCHAAVGRGDQAVADIREAREIACGTDEPSRIALADLELATALDVCGRTSEALDVARAGATQAIGRGIGRTYGALLEGRAVVAMYRLGSWAEALRYADAALEGTPLGPGRSAVLLGRALVDVGRGADDAARAELDEALEAGDVGRPVDPGWGAAVRAEIALWAGDPGAALRAIASFAGADASNVPPGAPAAAPGDCDGGATLLAIAARTVAEVHLRARASGEPVEAPAAALETWARTVSRRRRRLPGGTAPELAIAAADLERACDGPAERQVGAWARAAADARGRRPYAEAYARWRLAEALLAARAPRARAQHELCAAAEIAAALGARPLAREIDLLARRARLSMSAPPPGTSPAPPSGSAGLFGLTEREREVLALVASGCTNREIGARLFISPKTASVHVSSILGKLGVDGRVAAATVAIRLGLAEPAEPTRADR